MKFKIKTRLTLLNALVVVLIQGAASAGIYAVMQHRLQAVVREKLDRGFDTVAEVLWNSGGDVYDIYHFGETHVFCLFGQDKVEFASKGWTQSSLPKSFPKNANTYFHLPNKTGGQDWIRLEKIPDYDFVLAYAQDATELDRSLRNLRWILIASLPCVFLLALLAGWFLARRALAPVADITNKAKGITADSLKERLPVANPEDEIGQLAQVFNAMLGRIDQAFERLKQFTSDASHELRTPLTALRSVGEVALQKKDAKDEAISSMLEETQRLTHLVDNLLLLARHDSGKLQNSMARCDLSELANKVVAELRILAEEKDQILELNAPMGIEVIADKASMRQAVTNVLHNAIIYSSAQGRIEMRVLSTDNTVRIEIEDNGPGIPVDQREQVFERFFRIDKARSRAQGGTGLGLAIARRAIEANGGTISFVDARSSGICCRISMPKPNSKR